MLSDGKDKNNSKFFITLSKYQELDGKKVAFGKIIKNIEILDLFNN